MFAPRITPVWSLSGVHFSLLRLQSARKMSTASSRETTNIHTLDKSTSAKSEIKESKLKSTLSPKAQSFQPATASREEDLNALTRSLDRVTLSTKSTTSPSLRVPSYTQSASAFKDHSKKRLHQNSYRSNMTPDRGDKKTQPSAKSGGIPDPTEDYLHKSSYPMYQLQEPQHLLVVIDLNGTLLFRPNRKNPTKFTSRPNTQRFLRYCIDTFTVVIWSSARPENVRMMCDAILSPDMRKNVAAIWGRDKFDLTAADYNLRTQCYKRLTKLWSDDSIAKAHPNYMNGGLWDQTNTVLVDDSFEKGRSEPYNLIEIPEFFGDGNEKGNILPQVHDHLNHLAMHSNVSACLRRMPFRPQLQQLNRESVQID